MSIHRVAQGECLSTIAVRYGYSSWKQLYDHPDNAALKAKRKNPNVLLPGDEVVLPERETKEVDCETGKTHRFKVKLTMGKVRIALQAHGGEPHKNAKWLIDVERTQLRGTTGSDGVIEVEVPLTATRLVVSAWYAEEDEAGEAVDFPDAEDDAEAAEDAEAEDAEADVEAEDAPDDEDQDNPGPPDVHYALRLGNLDPHDTVRGLQARLKCLGFSCPVSGTLCEATTSALRRFRLANALSIDGELHDDDVATKLRDLHDGAA